MDILTYTFPTITIEFPIGSILVIGHFT